MNADRIVVIEDGEVVEQGNHADLVTANGRYADLWSKQTFLKPKDDDSADGKKPTATNGDPKPNGTSKGNSASFVHADQDSQSASTDTGKGNEVVQTPSNHKKEVESAEDSSLADSDH